MARLTAAERYALRLRRQAIGLRQRTIEAADDAVRHARLSARYGPGWRKVLDDAWRRNLVEWSRVVEEYNLAGGGVSAAQEDV